MRFIETAGGLVIAAVGTIAPGEEGDMRRAGVGFTSFAVSASPKGVDGGASIRIALAVR